MAASRPPVPTSLRRRVRAGPVAGAVVVAALGAGAYVAWRELAHDAPSSPRDSEAVAPAADTSLGGASKGALVHGDPFADPGPLTTGAVRAGLGSRLVVRRLTTLRAVAERGVVDRAALDAIEALREADDPVERIWARAAAMRVRGDRRDLLELARLAADAPAFDDPARAVRVLDPAAGEALLRAVAEARRRASSNARVLDGLEGAAERLAEDPKAGGAAVASALAAADPQDLPAWGGVLVGLRPAPAVAIATLVERWRRGGPDERRAIQRVLGGAEGDWSAAGPELGAFVAERLSPGSPGDPATWCAIVRKLPRVDADLRARLVEVARRDVVAAQNVLAAVSSLGERGADVASDLLPVVAALPDATRVAVVPALAALGSDDVLAYAAERIARGEAAEVGAWLDALRPADRPDAVVEALAEVAGRADEEVAARGAAAVARVSGRAPTSATSAALGRVLDDGRAAVRGAALAGLEASSRIDDATLRRLVRAVDDADPAARAAAVRTVSGVWRLGADAKPLVPTLLRLASDVAAAERVPDVRARAARSLAAIAPDDPDVRTALLGFARDTAADVRMAGVWGLSRLPSPTPDEKAALVAMKDDPQLGALVLSTLSRPGWASVK